MAQMHQKDKPTYYNLVIMGNRVIAHHVPKSKVQKTIKEMSLTYAQKIEAVLEQEG